MEQTTYSYLREQLKQAQTEQKELARKLMESEYRNLGLIAENNTLTVILRSKNREEVLERTRGNDADKDATA